MSQYICKNCNYKTNRFPDMKVHLSKAKPCTSDLTDHHIIMSLIPHDENGVQNISISSLKNYNGVYLNNRAKLIDRLSNVKKCCSFCNSEFNKVQELKDHIILECFYKEMILKGGSVSIIPFDTIWDVSHLFEYEKKLDILCSDILFSKLLQKILESPQNQNVKFVKDIGYIYKKGEKFVKASIDEIVSVSMNKLKDILLEMNTSLKNKKFDGQLEMNSFFKFNDERIKKKYNEYLEKNDIKQLVATKFIELYKKSSVKSNNNS